MEVKTLGKIQAFENIAKLSINLPKLNLHF